MSRRRPLLIAALLAAVALAGTGLVLSTGDDDEPTLAGEEPARAAPPVQACNGDEAFCDLTLDRVVFPGTHNSMSSVAYGGWLFGEQSQPIRAQLDAGIRALLVDAHYGSLDQARSQEAGRPIVTAAIQGDIFLCHVHCELGALPFGDALADVRAFLDDNPFEVVMLIVQDATSPVDTAAAIAAAGLAERAATLPARANTNDDGDRPLPTLRELIASGKNLVVFAEKGGRGAPRGTSRPSTGSRRRRSPSPTPTGWGARRAAAGPTRPSSSSTTGW